MSGAVLQMEPYIPQGCPWQNPHTKAKSLLDIAESDNCHTVLLSHLFKNNNKLPICLLGVLNDSNCV